MSNYPAGYILAEGATIEEMAEDAAARALSGYKPCGPIFKDTTGDGDDALTWYYQPMFVEAGAFIERPEWLSPRKGAFRFCLTRIIPRPSRPNPPQLSAPNAVAVKQSRLIRRLR